MQYVKIVIKTTKEEMKNKGKVFSFAVALAIAVTGMFLISSCGSTQDAIDMHNSFVDGWNQAVSR